MSTSSTISTPADVQASRAFLQELFAGYPERDFAVQFWDGSRWDADVGQPTRFTLVLRHPGAVRQMFWPPRPLSFSTAYLYDDFNVEGDILAFQCLCRYLNAQQFSLSAPQKIKLGWSLWNLPKVEMPRQGRTMARLTGRPHSRERDLQAIRYHYDLSNPFFEKILDPYMQYTSGVFAEPGEGLAAAQERKLDLVCRKLRLQPGDRLLDIGCGWGGLAMFAARSYGAHVVGVTLSQFQAEWAQAKIRAAGLEDRCRIELTDYRDLKEPESFDKIATIEVAEHFGAEQFPAYMTQCERLLRPGGALLMQQITLSGKECMPPADKEFSQNFVFPDGELVPASFTLRQAEDARFEIRDVECFREHYPLTLKHWLANLEGQREGCIADTDETTYRIFRLYLSGALSGFERNIYNLHQMLLLKPNHHRSEVPLGRGDWYV